MTYAQAIYIIADLSKALTTDDSFIGEDHIRFLLNRYRALILKAEAEKAKKKISQANYQTICLDLEVSDVYEDGNPCTNGVYLRSTQEVPDTLDIGSPLIYPMDYFNSNITYVSRERMRYVGHNKYLKNIIYACIGPDNKLYFKSNNPQHKYLEKVKFSGVFEDAERANELSCSSGASNCDPLENEFPIDSSLFPQLQGYVLKDIVGVEYKPTDGINDAKDDLSALATFIRNNSKSALSKQLDT